MHIKKHEISIKRKRKMVKLALPIDQPIEQTSEKVMRQPFYGNRRIWKL